MNLNISQNGILFIQGFESFVSCPYLDSVGVPTIGWGTTYYPNLSKVTLKDACITQAQATQYLLANLVNYVNGVDSMVTSQINQNQFDALVSFSYNLGVQALRSSTLLKLVNTNPNDTAIGPEINKWCHAGGMISQGLIKRRAAESKLYFS